MVCSRCIMDDTADISFDENGVCNYCKEYEKKEYQRVAESFHPGLQWTLHEIRKAGEGKDYDCLIGLSGGVDSAMCLHYMAKENGLRPLCFSMDNGWNEKLADENVLRMVEKLKVPYYKYAVNGKEFRNLQDAFIAAGVKNIEIPTDHVLMALTYRIAAENGIKYIISGGNLATEGTMPKCWGYEPRDLKHIKAIFRRFNGRRMRGIPTISLPKYLYSRFIKGIKIIQPLNFYTYEREKAKKLLREEYRWKDYGAKHEESIFTQWFQNFYLPQKWGIDKRKAHLSSLIHSGQMTRDRALAELAEPLRFRVTGREETVLEIPRHEYTDYPNNNWIWEFLQKIHATLKRL